MKSRAPNIFQIEHKVSCILLQPIGMPLKQKKKSHVAHDAIYD
jgi:hypothetical protein